MAANTSPIYTLTPSVQWGATALSAANTAKDGTGTVLTVFTAGTEGAFIQKIRFRPAGTNIATVARIFINNGSSNATPGNNILYDDLTLTAVTNIETGSVQMFELPLNIALQGGYKLNIALGTAVANGYFISVVGGNY